jgi:hypothetical protein
MRDIGFDGGFEDSELPDGIWQCADGRYRVIVGGHQVGLWTKKRWAKKDLRGELRAIRHQAAP